MRATRARSLALAGLGMFAAAAAPAQDDILAATLARLSTNLGGIRTLETSFVQEKHLAVLEQVMTIRGKVYMAEPDRLAWHVARPIRYTMIMDGRSIQQWDAESGQSFRISLADNPALQVAVDQMRQWFSGDYTRMVTLHRITLEQENPVLLTFVPLPENPAGGYIERVTVKFTGDERYLASIAIVEKGGDRTELRFHDTKLDQEIPAAAWELRSPEAAE